MEGEEFGKNVYLSKTGDTNRRLGPLGGWKGRVKEYINERGTGRRGRA